MLRLNLLLGALLLTTPCLSDTPIVNQFLYPNGHLTFRQGDTVQVMWETTAAFIYLYLNGPDSSVDGQLLLANSPAPSYTWHINNATANYYFALHAANSDGTTGIDEAHSPLFSVAAAVASIAPSTWNVDNSPTSTSAGASASSSSLTSSSSPSSNTNVASTFSTKTSSSSFTRTTSKFTATSSTASASISSSTPMSTSTLTGGTGNTSDPSSKSSGGLSHTNQIIVGVCVGIGGSLLLAGLVLWRCRSRFARGRKSPSTVKG